MTDAETIAQAHQWHGGYVCSCGHELNSPRGFTRHVLEVAEVDRLRGVVARIEALADDWAAYGWDSVYETANELAQALRDALSGDETPGQPGAPADAAGGSEGAREGAEGDRTVIHVPREQYDRLMSDDEEQR